ncbi:MAG: UDP-glucose/GDP-mannose dehydrogenase family protein [Rhodothermales bacterium]|nr:UDP-glucose/GDP-mannose dehydrogenase family protein [Rhodothermales bacterium]
MNISVFGMGYVGVVSAACLARDGHTVIGVDPNETKVELIDSGHAPIIEAEVDELISEAVTAGRLSAGQDAAAAVRNSDVSLVCVGTPSQSNGSLDLRYVKAVCAEIGQAIREKDGYHVVVMRSTMLPGSMLDVVLPTLEDSSGMNAGTDFGIAINPEFLREGSAVFDYRNPPKTVIGCTDDRSGEIVAELYRHLPAELVVTDLKTAEMVKYVDNVWHALKIGFANEVGNVAKAVGVDGHRVMEVFCLDTKLNLSPYYLKPGFAFGGSCLPKDVRAFTYKARMLDLKLPILESILPSNELQVSKGFEMVVAKGGRKIAILGFSFKAGTDDLRESPMVELIERLIGKGYELQVYDKNVNLARLVGANRDYILNRIPHIAALMVENIEDAIEDADVVVIGNGDPDFIDVPKRLEAGQQVVDLVRVSESENLDGSYDGICW